MMSEAYFKCPACGTYFRATPPWPGNTTRPCTNCSESAPQMTPKEVEEWLRGTTGEVA